MNRVLLAGPSHVIRIQKSMLKQHSPIVENAFLYGLGGMPIWYKSFILYLEKNHQHFDHIILMVPDFRFGNAVFSVNKKIEANYNGFFSGRAPLAISSEFLNSKNDQKLYDNCLKTLDYLVSLLGGKLTLVFWCLAGRELLNNKEKKYLFDGCYQHPIWNYSSLLERYSNFTVDVYKKLKLDYDKMIIDRACHPSKEGIEYLFNSALIRNESKNVYFKEAKEQADHFYKNKKYAEAFHMYCRLIQNVGYLPELVDKASMCALLGKLYEKMIELFELKPPHIQLNSSIRSRLGFIYFQLGKLDKARFLLKASLSENENQPVAMMTLSEVMFNTGHIEEAYEIINSTLLLNGFNKAQKHLLKVLASAKKSKFDSNIDDTSTFLPDVAIGHNDNIFLLGGAHKVKNYVGGRVIPPTRSVDNFYNNIMSRSKFLKDKNIDYAHIIFPDKNSLLESDFPYQQKYTLGDYYLGVENFDKKADINSLIIYPKNELISRNELGGLDNMVTIKGDSHLSDIGFLIIIQQLLSVLEPKNQYLYKNFLLAPDKHEFKKAKILGDLGIKFTPSKMSTTLVFKHQQYCKPIDNGIISNDGLVKYWLNFSALSDKTVLIFGDSYFNCISEYLSLIYRKVIFCRSRFFHKEVADSISPDIILTGNAERYLSFVSSDTSASSFNKYYLKKKKDEAKYNEFKECLNIKSLLEID